MESGILKGQYGRRIRKEEFERYYMEGGYERKRMKRTIREEEYRR